MVTIDFSLLQTLLHVWPKLKMKENLLFQSTLESETEIN